MKINHHYEELKPSYLFREVAERTAAYSKTASEKSFSLIRLGIGDVTRPLPKVVVDAMIKAAKEMGEAETFRGYGPEQGYDFLREAISRYHAAHADPQDIFVSDGAKTDLGAVLDLFDQKSLVAVQDPVYPVYVDTNLMDGRKILYMQGTLANGFCPVPSDMTREEAPDIIYLCSPNNPTGAVYSYEKLKQWVDYANEHDSVILYDAAYEAFITEDFPRSIYQIPGAERCAIEFGSFSKMAGFTGLRCGFSIVPSTLVREGMNLRDMWLRRQSTKMNGVSYPVQRAAEAALTEEGLAECRKTISYYRENAAILAEALTEAGIRFTGGIHSPYLWLKCPGGMKSWEFFDFLLKEAGLVGTPGSGFGEGGEGFFRVTAFGSREDTLEAAKRLTALKRQED